MREAETSAIVGVTEKTCASCGRAIEPRRRWRRNWQEVRYCSAACRRRRRDDRDAELERAILLLLSNRATGATICPSEAARAVEPDGWRELMERVRCAARRLVASGVVEIVRGGRVIDPSRARGAIRLRLRRVGGR